ncbi:MAG: cob(I)yrinic acid a,c-diamide adenosyltransferase [Peptococcaceae bacterium]|jgi:cob(I)alamin adenosyltransferase|nr:cob(I)yrinic acid a,c-diamide adenosyltransferase [Peptococcaceae bacterium]
MYQDGKGYVHVYTGNGKGKTTAAIGLAIRALGAGHKVYFCQFMKELNYSEHKILRKLEPGLRLEGFGKPYFLTPDDVDAGGRKPATAPFQEYMAVTGEGMKRVREIMNDGAFDLVILDEVNVAVHFGLVAVERVTELIENRKAHVEMVLTGRAAPRELIERADLVTEFKEIKHYFQQGVGARPGIDN